MDKQTIEAYACQTVSPVVEHYLHSEPSVLGRVCRRLIAIACEVPRERASLMPTSPIPVASD